MKASSREARDIKVQGVKNRPGIFLTFNPKIMTVDFNGLQRNAVRSYNDLIKIVEESTMIANGSAGTHKLLEVYELSEALDRLREDILSLACIIPPGGKDISDEPGFKLKFFEVPEEEEYLTT